MTHQVIPGSELVHERLRGQVNNQGSDGLKTSNKVLKSTPELREAGHEGAGRVGVPGL